MREIILNSEFILWSKTCFVCFNTVPMKQYKVLINEVMWFILVANYILYMTASYSVIDMFSGPMYIH